jgi:hypothetical protein
LRLQLGAWKGYGLYAFAQRALNVSAGKQVGELVRDTFQIFDCIRCIRNIVACNTLDDDGKHEIIG